MKNDRSRREFLKWSAAASACVAAGPRPLRAASVGEKLSIGVIGCGIRGGAHVQLFGKHPECVVAYVCDPDLQRCESLAERVEELQGTRPKVVQDLRYVLDDASVDCVSVATCNHWHVLASIWAMQAGKDVYVEKPLSWCIEEGRRIVQAAREHQRICQVGTQYRSDATIHEAKRFLDAGGIGKVRMARTITYNRRRAIGGAVDGKAPASCDYNLWAGPAPMTPVRRRSFHYDWHWFWNFGNGEIGNNDVHRMDLVCWALNRHQLANASISFGGRFGFQDVAETPNTQISIHDLGGVTLVSEVRNLETESFALPANAIIHGSDGAVLLKAGGSSLLDPDGNLVRRFEGAESNSTSLAGAHVANFIEAVKTRRRDLQNSEVAQGHVSAGICHQANNSYRLGEKVSVARLRERLAEREVNASVGDLVDRTLAHLESNEIKIGDDTITAGPWLDLDPHSERYVGNQRADELLSRDYRAPFVVPSAARL